MAYRELAKEVHRWHVVVDWEGAECAHPDG